MAMDKSMADAFERIEQGIREIRELCSAQEQSSPVVKAPEKVRIVVSYQETGIIVDEYVVYSATPGVSIAALTNKIRDTLSSRFMMND